MKRFTLKAVLLFAFFALNYLSAAAQCAMCRASVQGDAKAAVASQTLNLAALVLIVPPVVIFCALFILLLRYRRAMDERPRGRLGDAGSF